MKLYSILLMVVILTFFVASYYHFDLCNLQSIGVFTIKPEVYRIYEVLVTNSIECFIYTLLFVVYLFNLAKAFPLVFNLTLTIVFKFIAQTTWNFLNLIQTKIENKQEYIDFGFAEFRLYLDEDQIISKISDILANLKIPEVVTEGMKKIVAEKQLEFMTWFSEGSRIAEPKVTQVLTEELTRLINEHNATLAQVVEKDPSLWVVFGICAYVIGGFTLYLNPLLHDLFYFPLVGPVQTQWVDWRSFLITNITTLQARMTIGHLINIVGKITAWIKWYFGG